MAGLQKLEFRCLKSTSTGTVCQAPKQKGRDHCAKHSPEKMVLATLGQNGGVVPVVDLSSLDEIYLGIADTINRLRQNELKPQQGAAIFNGFGKLLDAVATKEKYDPKKTAGREITQVMARRLAEGMSITQAREILSNRDKNALKNMLNSPFADRIFVEAEAERAQLEKETFKLEVQQGDDNDIDLVD